MKHLARFLLLLAELCLQRADSHDRHVIDEMEDAGWVSSRSPRKSKE